MATNAAKYGALSTKNGRVSVRWDERSKGHARSNLVLEWQESGGPAVVATGKSSYGTSTIRDLIPYEFGGTVDLVLAPEGVRCLLELPADWSSSDSEALSRGTTHANNSRVENTLRRLRSSGATPSQIAKREANFPNYPGSTSRALCALLMTALPRASTGSLSTSSSWRGSRNRGRRTI